MGGGGGLYLCQKCPRLVTLPPGTARPCSVRPSPAAFLLWARGVHTWGPVTEATAHALASWLCRPWGWQKGGQEEGHLKPS